MTLAQLALELLDLYYDAKMCDMGWAGTVLPERCPERRAKPEQEVANYKQQIEALTHQEKP